MKHTLIILLISLTSLYSQTYKAVLKYKGEVSDSIHWISQETINNKFTINKQSITIEDNKYTFKLLKRISNNNNELIYYAKDWEDLRCYIIIETFEGYKYIYFQWSNLIVGYKIIRI